MYYDILPIEIINEILLYTMNKTNYYKLLTLSKQIYNYFYSYCMKILYKCFDSDHRYKTISNYNLIRIYENIIFESNKYISVIFETRYKPYIMYFIILDDKIHCFHTIIDGYEILIDMYNKAIECEYDDCIMYYGNKYIKKMKKMFPHISTIYKHTCIY